MECAEEELTQIRKLIHSAATDSRQWPKFLEALKALFSANVAIWGEYDTRNPAGSIRSAVGIEYDFIRDYNERYAHCDPWLSNCDCWSEGHVGRGEEIIASDRLANTEFYHEWLQPQGLFYRLHAVVKTENGRIQYLSILRSVEAGDFEDWHFQLMKSLTSEIVQAISCNDKHWRLAVTLDVLNNFLPFGVLAVDEDCRVLFSNTAADELFSTGDSIHQQDGRIVVSGRELAKQFNDVVTSVAFDSAPKGRGHNAGKAFLVPRRGSRLPLWLVITPLSRKLRWEIGHDNHVALIFVMVPEHMGSICEVTLQTLFGLTMAEQKIAKLIVEGSRLNEAADKLGITINTARTHMKRVFAKTDTGCQADLVRLLLSGQFTQLFCNDQLNSRTA